jgi:hypothetical protein
VDPQPVLTLLELNQALLNGLLPVQDTPGQSVLLGCDDSSLRAVIGGNDPVGTLVAVLQAGQPVTTATGFAAALAAAAEFDRQPRPRPGPPPQLAALCVCVLAASRMDYTEHHHTSAYYTHLLDLLGVTGQPDWPYLPGFEQIAGTGFRQLADWLAGDLAGARGRLVLPTVGAPRYVGVPVSQTLLRGRDRSLLADFFWRYRRPLEAGWNPARLVRLWGGRHHLTAPAQERLDDRHLARQLAAALRSAYSAWDGTRIDGDGHAVWPATLRLGVNPVRAALHATVPGLAGPVIVTDPEGKPFSLTTHPLETVVPLDWLAYAVNGPLRAPVSDGNGTVELVDSPTMLFELTDIGLESVPLAGDRPVWALTCDPQLTSLPLPPGRFHRQPLPSGWKLIVELTSDELPENLRSPGPDPEPDGGLDAKLTGGLMLGASTWLIDYPPAIVSHLPEPAILLIDEDEHGDLDPGQVRPLDEIAGAAGIHRLDLGGAFEAEIELTERGLRDGIGTVHWDLGHPSLLRHGALAGDHLLGGNGPTVTGAAVQGGPALDWHPPIMLRGGGTAHAIHADGTVTAHWPAPAPAWMRHAGLADDSNPEWSIDDDGSIVWVCANHPARPRTIAIRDQPIRASDDTLDVVYEFAGATVIGDDDARKRWQALVKLAADDDGG